MNDRKQRRLPSSVDCIKEQNPVGLLNCVNGSPSGEKITEEVPTVFAKLS